MNKLIIVSRCEEPFLTHLAVIPINATDFNGCRFLCCCFSKEGALQKVEPYFDYVYDIDWNDLENTFYDPQVPLCLDCLDRCLKLFPELIEKQIRRKGGYAGYFLRHGEPRTKVLTKE